VRHGRVQPLGEADARQTGQERVASVPPLTSETARFVRHELDRVAAV